MHNHGGMVGMPINKSLYYSGFSPFFPPQMRFPGNHRFFGSTVKNERETVSFRTLIFMRTAVLWLPWSLNPLFQWSLFILPWLVSPIVTIEFSGIRKTVTIYNFKSVPPIQLFAIDSFQKLKSNNIWWLQNLQTIDFSILSLAFILPSPICTFSFSSGLSFHCRHLHFPAPLLTWLYSPGQTTYSLV